MTKTNVPRLRFRGFEEEWKFGHLSDVGLVKMNKRIHKNETKDTGDVPFFKIGTFGKKPDAFITRNRFLELKEHYPYPKPGDILISASGTLGRTVVYEGKDEYFQDSNIIWLDLNNKKMINLFLLQFYKQHIWKSEGTTIKRLYNKDIYSTSISYPSVYEQKKIGTFFAKIDKIIELETQKLGQLKKLKQGYLQKMFPQYGESLPRLRFSGFGEDWKISTISNYFQYFNGGALEKNISGNGKYNVINLNSISINGILQDNGKYVSEDIDTLNKDDLIMILSDIAHGNLIGITAVIDNDNKYVLNQRVGLLRLKNHDNSSEYFHAYINRKRRYFKRTAAGTSQLNLSKKDIMNCRVLVPCIREQEKISRFLLKLDQLINSQSKKIEALKQQKKAYLQKMFI